MRLPTGERLASALGSSADASAHDACAWRRYRERVALLASAGRGATSLAAADFLQMLLCSSSAEGGEVTCAARAGAGLAAVYTAVLLGSSNYPGKMLAWTLPQAFADSYRAFLALVVGPPVLAGLLLLHEVRRPSRLAAVLWLVLSASVAVEAIAAATSVAPLHSIVFYVLRDGAMAFLGLALASGRSTLPLRWLSLALVAVITAQALTGLAEGFWALWLTGNVGTGVAAPGVDPGLGAFPRVTGLTAYHTIYGVLIGAAQPIIVSAIPKRRWSLPLLALTTAALVFSGSRGAWLGALAGLLALVTCWARGHAVRCPPVVFSVGLAATAFVAVLALQPERFTQLHIIPYGVRQSLALTERIRMEMIAADLWRTHPWFGVGSGNFAPAARHLPQYAEVTYRIIPVHNWLLLRLAEGGIAGAVVAIGLWAAPVLWLLFRARDRRDRLMLWALTVLAVSQWVDYEILYWPGGPLLQDLLFALWLGRVGALGIRLTVKPSASFTPTVTTSSLLNQNQAAHVRQPRRT